MTNGNARRPAGPPREIAHVGYVVESIPKAVDLWARTFGVGPFFRLENVVFDELSQGSQQLTFEHSNAFAMWGGIAVEFWEVDKFEPQSAFGPRFAPTGSINHVAYYVDDIRAESERLGQEGYPLIMQGRVIGIELRIHDAPELGHMIEIQSRPDSTKDFGQVIADATRDWDGSEPLRSTREVLGLT